MLYDGKKRSASPNEMAHEFTDFTVESSRIGNVLLSLLGVNCNHHSQPQIQGIKAAKVNHLQTAPRSARFYWLSATELQSPLFKTTFPDETFPRCLPRIISCLCCLRFH